MNDKFINNILPLLNKYKVNENDIYTIANSVEESYNIGWSSGYNDCEMNIDESIY